MTAPNTARPLPTRNATSGSAERPDCSLPHRAGEGAAIAAARLAPSLVHAGEGAVLSGGKFCALCGKYFERGKSKPGAWRTRRFCSQACANRSRPSKDVKPCECCGRPMYRSAGFNHLSDAAWKRRRFCGRECLSEWRKKAALQPRQYVVESAPGILKEWPPEERFDRPGMVVHEKPRGVCRVAGTPEWSRWI